LLFSETMLNFCLTRSWKPKPKKPANDV
jgi:hypothetical protein